jgi:uncharacterized membrane protein YhaH (DUF805 family)
MDIDWGNLLFSFSGRVNRAKYWLMVLVALIVGLICAVLVLFLGVIGIILAAILYIGLVIAGIAVGIKRLHDRDKSGWWLALFYLGVGLLSGLSQGFNRGESSGIGLIFSLATFAISIWALVELGCLRGTPGPNRYGPDPLAGRIT